MKRTKRNFSCRIEELTVIGGFVASSMEASIQDFKGYSPDLDMPYLENFNMSLQAANEIVFPRKLTEEIKVVTERLISTMNQMRGNLNRLEGYVEMATGLNTGVSGFCIKEVRKSISRKDVEQLLKNLKIMNRAISENFSVLQEKGMKAELQSYFMGVQQQLENDNNLQNIKMNEKEALVEENIDKLNLVWDMITNIMKTGKRIYKDLDESKTREFTLSVIKERIRQENKRKKEEEKNAQTS